MHFFTKFSPNWTHRLLTFTTLSINHIKVDQFSITRTITDKEKEYRRLDPEFKILHAYKATNVATEEKRILSALRLVAGTSVKEVGRETFDIPLQEAVKPASSSVSVRKQRACKAILAIKTTKSGTVASRPCWHGICLR